MEQITAWPEWEITEKIGKGSYGSVYKIQRDFLGNKETAALKIMSIPQDPDEIQNLRSGGYDEDSIRSYYRSTLEQLVKEYSVMLRLKGYTNIVCCDELRYEPHADGYGWDIYLKMELLTPMNRIPYTRYSEEEVIRLGLDMCSALELCRLQGIIHRDIKPDNIFISSNGDYKLGDFGVAKSSSRTAAGTIVGTFAYMAPEVCRGMPYGTASDLYALGLVMYWMMNERRLPFLCLPPQIPTAAEKEHARNRRLCGEPLPAPRNGSMELQNIVLRACAYDISQRCTLEELRTVLESLLKGGTVSHSHVSQQPVYENTGYQPQQRLHQQQDTYSAPPQYYRTAQNRTTYQAQPQDYAQTYACQSKAPKKRKLLPVLAAALFLCLALVCSYFLITGPLSNLDLFSLSDSSASDKDGRNSLEEDDPPPQTQPEETTLTAIETTASTEEAETTAPATEATTLATTPPITEGIVAIDAGGLHSLALFADGTVKAAGYSADGQCNVSSWRNIIAVSAGDRFSLGLRSDGTVVGCGLSDNGRRDVGSWQNIRQIDAGLWHSVGVTEANTAVSAGVYYNGSRVNVSGWTNVRQIDAGENHTVAVLFDGTVVADGDTSDGKCNVSGWTDIIYVAAGVDHTVGLRSDGTLVAVGSNQYGQINVSGWTDIVAIAVGDYHTVGLRSDGTVVATGWTKDYGQCSVSHYQNVRLISAGWAHTLLVTEDGSALLVGHNKNNHGADVSAWD